MLLDQATQLGLVRRVDRVEADELHVAALGEAAVDVEDVGHTAAHAGAEVAPGAAEHDDGAAGHVLAAVVADALDDGVDAGVAHREALAREAAEEGPAQRRAVQDGVADDDVLLRGEGRLHRRKHGDNAAGQALAGVVVRVAARASARCRAPARHRTTARLSRGR